MRAGDTPERAAAGRRASQERFFPDGRLVDGQLLFTIVAAGEDAGWLWIGPMEDPSSWYVWDVAVHEAFRGRGIGEATMLLAEDVARSQRRERAPTQRVRVQRPRDPTLRSPRLRHRLDAPAQGPLAHHPASSVETTAKPPDGNRIVADPSDLRPRRAGVPSGAVDARRRRCARRSRRSPAAARSPTSARARSRRPSPSSSRRDTTGRTMSASSVTVVLHDPRRQLRLRRVDADLERTRQQHARHRADALRLAAAVERARGARVRRSSRSTGPRRPRESTPPARPSGPPCRCRGRTSRSRRGRARGVEPRVQRLAPSTPTPGSRPRRSSTWRPRPRRW